MIKELWLFTNRNTLAFDENGEQCTFIQSKINCYEMDRLVAIEAIETAEKFYISKYREWEHEITKREMMFLLGLGRDVE